MSGPRSLCAVSIERTVSHGHSVCAGRSGPQSLRLMLCVACSPLWPPHATWHTTWHPHWTDHRVGSRLWGVIQVIELGTFTMSIGAKQASRRANTYSTQTTRSVHTYNIRCAYDTHAHHAHNTHRRYSELSIGFAAHESSRTVALAPWRTGNGRGISTTAVATESVCCFGCGFSVQPFGATAVAVLSVSESHWALTVQPTGLSPHARASLTACAPMIVGSMLPLVATVVQQYVSRTTQAHASTHAT